MIVYLLQKNWYNGVMENDLNEISKLDKNYTSEKAGNYKPRFFSAAILVVLSFFVGYFAGNDRFEAGLTNDVVAGKYSEAPASVKKEVDFDLFWQVWDILQKDHISKPLSESDLFYGAINGLVDAVGDPYTQFFSPEKAAEFTEQLTGSFEGIGAEIGIRDEKLVVIAPLPGTPAERSGIRAGDEILTIDGKDTFGMSVEDAVYLIRGPKQTTVVLGIKHDDENRVVDISVIRDTIQIASVVTKELTIPGQQKPTVEYIGISQFNEDTPATFHDAVQKALANESEAIILDLRNNPGGYLEAAVDVASYWIEDGPVVIEKKPGVSSFEHKAVGVASLANIPTIVLVNEGSASASEIVAGALQDYGKATLVGEKTFGKGSVQEFQLLSDGSALKVTVTLWYTPKGRSINDDGIEPDKIIEFDADLAAQGIDNVLNSALESLRK